MSYTPPVIPPFLPSISYNVPSGYTQFPDKIPINKAPECQLKNDTNHA